MRTDELNKSIDETVTLILNVADAYLGEIEEQLEVTRSPEKLLGKPYEQFTEQDFQILSQVYGEEEPNPLSELIFKKSYEQVLALEEEEI